MFARIYIEEALDHPRTKLLLKKYHKLHKLFAIIMARFLM